MFSMVTGLILQVSPLVGDAESTNDVVVENADFPTVLWKWVFLWKEDGAQCDGELSPSAGSVLVQCPPGLAHSFRAYCCSEAVGERAKTGMGERNQECVS